jgi:hypothetical protein
MTQQSDPITRVALGAAAGLAATFALQGIRTKTMELLPETTPPIREEPGKFMVEQAEELLAEETRAQIPSAVETTAATSLALGYGATAGAIYGALRSDGGNPLIDGAILGVGTWAVGYLGWLPATDLMAPVQEQEPEQVVTPIAQHIFFGIATAATYHWLHRITSG